MADHPPSWPGFVPGDAMVGDSRMAGARGGFGAVAQGGCRCTASPAVLHIRLLWSQRRQRGDAANLPPPPRANRYHRTGQSPGLLGLSQVLKNWQESASHKNCICSLLASEIASWLIYGWRARGARTGSSALPAHWCCRDTMPGNTA